MCLLNKHATEVWDLIETLAPDILFLTENWLNPASAPDIAPLSQKAT